MGAVVAGDSHLDHGFVAAMTTCVQCRGCETACPSGVPFGSMMVEARRAIAEGPRRRSARLTRLVFRLVAIRWVLVTASWLAAVGQRLRLVPSRRLGLPRQIPLRQPRLSSSGDDVVLFTGCVMDVWQREVHADLAWLVERTGRGVSLPQFRGGCCGALAEHGGLADLAQKQAGRTMASIPGTGPVLVDSAGCGAMLKEYGTLFGTADAVAFSARVFDANTWMADHLDELGPTLRASEPVAIQDPCHLRHVQRVHHPVRSVVGRAAPVVELDDDGMCCGAGGAFAMSHPQLADDIRSRKLAAIARSKATVVASANPGCAIHLEWAGVDARHPISILATAVRSGEGSTDGE
jgi:glycolate oxidase iron-sulfur subunit